MNNPQGSKAKRRADIEENITKILELIKEHEDLLVAPVSPDQKHNASRRITELKQFLADQEAELEKLNGFQLDKNPSASTSQEYVKTDLDKNLAEIKEELKRGFDDIKRGQDDIQHILSTGRKEEIRSIIELIRAGIVSQEEMGHTLQIIQDSLVILQENDEELSTEVRAAIAQAKSALNSEMGLQGKLELTLPIIPAILDYKVEFAASDTVDLNQFFENSRTWWNSLTKRAYKNLWSIDTLEEYGNFVQSGDPQADPLQIARKSLKQYHSELEEQHKTIAGFDARIHQSVSNLNILIKAQEQFNSLQKTSESFLQDVLRLSEKPNYPKQDLERIKELSGSILAQIDAVAGSVANNGNPIQQINQIKRNLPTLRRILKQLLSWLEQMKSI